MQTSVRGIIALLLLGMSLLHFSSCVPPDPFHTLTGTWHLVRYEDGNTAAVLEEPNDIPRPVILTFSDRGSKGTFTGETVTNQLRGSYEIENDGDMSIIEIDGTLMGEPSWSADVWKGLESATQYRLTGDMLEIYYDDGLKRMVFDRLGG